MLTVDKKFFPNFSMPSNG